MKYSKVKYPLIDKVCQAGGIIEDDGDAVQLHAPSSYCFNYCFNNELHSLVSPVVYRLMEDYDRWETGAVSMGFNPSTGGKNIPVTRRQALNKCLLDIEKRLECTIDECPVDCDCKF